MFIIFNSIIGQTQAKKLLTISFNRGKTSHAYLFRGPVGVGKKTCAHAFACLINCHAPTANDACGNCPSCKKYSSSNHPDLIQVEPQGAGIKIDQIRKLKKDLTYPPFEAKFRVVLIEDIHLTMRRKEVANSLLKTLEEPPDDTIFILTGDESGDILPTILSRCQIIPFYPLPYEQVTKILINDGIGEQIAATLCGIAEGSLGRARSLFKDDLLVLRTEIIKNILQCSANQPSGVEIIFLMAEKAASAKENTSEILDLITLWFRDLMLVHNNLAKKIINHDISHLMPKACNRWSFEDINEKLNLLDTARRQLQRNCNRNMVFEVLFFDLL
jgi:DNA polymerase III subunit delta'